MKYAMQPDFDARVSVLCWLLFIPVVVVFGGLSIKSILFGVGLSAFLVAMHVLAWRFQNHLAFYESHLHVRTAVLAAEFTTHERRDISYQAIRVVHVAPRGFMRMDVNPDPTLPDDAEPVPLEFWPKDWRAVVDQIQRTAPHAQICLEAELGGGSHGWYKGVNP